MVDIIIGVCGIVLGIVAAWLYHRSAEAVLIERLSERERRVQEAGSELQSVRSQYGALLTANTALNAKVAELATTLAQERKSAAERLALSEKAAQEKLALLEEARRRLADAFQALSAEALKGNNAAFLQLAHESLEKYQLQARSDWENRQKAVEDLVKPLADSLTKVDRQIQDVEKTRIGAYAELTAQVQAMSGTQAKLQAETANLATALRTPHMRGRWGEIQLQRVVELAGMVERCDFDLQPSAETANGRIRPDLVVRLPLGRSIVVDAKAPLKAYLESIDASDEAVRAGKLKEHAAQLRSHMNQLAAKSYWAQFQPAPEFVVLFLPGDAMYSAALHEDPSLIEAGPEQGVMLATPTTLIALLKAVAYGWRQEALAENAQQIADLGREIYTRTCSMGGHLIDLRNSLVKTVDAYNDAVGSLESRVLVSARKFKELGAGTDQEIEVIQGIETAPRAPQAPEFEATGAVSA